MRNGLVCLTLAGALLGAGCAGPQQREQPPLATLAAAVPTDLAHCRSYALQLAARASAEARRLAQAREKDDEAEIEAAMASLADNDRAVEALDEAVRHLELVLSYLRQRPHARLASAELQRLDADIRAVREGAVSLAEHAMALVQARGSGQPERVERARAEIERDRAYLEALRTDLLITARFGPTLD